MSETITLSKADAIELVAGEPTKGYTHVDDEHEEDRRWSALHFLVIKREKDGKLFGASYSRGLTEMQDEGPFEYDGPVIEFEEVEPYEVTKYKVKK